MFHLRDGWYFGRLSDGSVFIEKRETAQDHAPVVASVMIDRDSWASVVAAVSAAGETGAKYRLAQSLHNE